MMGMQQTRQATQGADLVRYRHVASLPSSADWLTDSSRIKL